MSSLSEEVGRDNYYRMPTVNFSQADTKDMQFADEMKLHASTFSEEIMQ